MLCGPPDSGKTMTLFSTLRKLPDMEVIGLQKFSSTTTPELILKTFEQYCEYRKSEQREWIMVTVINVGAVRVVCHARLVPIFSLNLSQYR
jgi:hypothetical protein